MEQHIIANAQRLWHVTR